MSLRDSYDDGFETANSTSTNAETCPECGGELDTTGEETNCRTCGLIVEEHRIDHGPEWRAFEDETTERARTGAPLTPARHDRGLSTEIGRGRDATGNRVSPGKRRRLSRLRREHKRARWQSKAERNLAHACGEIARMTGALGLPKAVRKEASQIYRRAQAADLIIGRAIETMAAGSLYAACRCRGLSRLSRDIAAVARCDQQKVELGYGILNSELGLQAQLIGASDRIPRFATECSASDPVQYRALELASIAEDAGLTNGRNPSGVAAACLYLAGEEFDVGYTQAELARHADVSKATVRERYYELQRQLS
jgi:transcription initiation factor TFIIB